jgi:hypothetical protein
MTTYELAGKLCRAMQVKRVERIGEPIPPPRGDPLADLPAEEIRNWIDVAEAVRGLAPDAEGGDAADTLRALVLDWDRYTLAIKDPAWRDEMRRAVVVEMQVAIDRLRKECA